MNQQKSSLDKDYWENRYAGNQTGWDVGEITTPLKEYFNQITDKTKAILIPGAGNAYEAAYLFENGFTNVTVVDLARHPLEDLKRRVPGFPDSHLVQSDFFELKGQFDLVVEQTFFCALDPAMRPEYARKMSEVIKPGGKLVGVLFNTHFEGGPPFGGTKEEYLKYFEPWFIFRVCEVCYNSIKPRAERELFIIFERK